MLTISCPSRAIIPALGTLPRFVYGTPGVYSTTVALTWDESSMNIVFMARYEKLRIGGSDVFAGWAPSPIGSVDNHHPEQFMEVVFSDECVEDVVP